MGVVTQLRARRTELGLSQAAVAQQMGVTQSEVALWETGRRTPGWDDLVRYTAAVNAVLQIALTLDPAGCRCGRGTYPAPDDHPAAGADLCAGGCDVPPGACDCAGLPPVDTPAAR